MLGCVAVPGTVHDNDGTRPHLHADDVIRWSERSVLRLASVETFPAAIHRRLRRRVSLETSLYFCIQNNAFLLNTLLHCIAVSGIARFVVDLKMKLKCFVFPRLTCFSLCSIYIKSSLGALMRTSVSMSSSTNGVVIL